MTPPRTVLVPAARTVRWFENFEARHGAAELRVDLGRLQSSAADGSVAQASLPFGREYDGPPDVAVFADAAARPGHWGILLVRKGGFAVATVDGTTIVASKVGQRHVQGRTKAGGQSQQRFARRRDNQARQAYEAAADHAHRLLVLESAPLEALVCGGDRPAVEAVLADARLGRPAAVRTGPWLAVPDPRRAVLVQAVVDGGSVLLTVTDAG
ncbi:MAG TPA: acVLRF1 family peptidyl-tRNA hydrolase [Nocardioidaceae bacterium]|nr:acVLRF1 family peptidyl-tRNA hydrolase [Nocardioidaceae bacterium]